MGVESALAQLIEIANHHNTVQNSDAAQSDEAYRSGDAEWILSSGF